MNGTRSRRMDWRRAAMVTLAGAALMATSACAHIGHVFGGTGAVRPAASEFGFGPRASARGMYQARLEPMAPLRKRAMQSVRVVVMNPAGAAVDGASIAVDGGMPQHGHGLPTRPRMTRQDGAGVYRIDGVRFNMGGWWEFKLAISTSAGTDTVTFNLDL